MKIRAGLWGLCFVAAAGLLVFGDSAPALVVFAASISAGIIFLFLAADFLLGRWLRRQIGKQVHPLHFFFEECPGLLVLTGIVLGALWLLYWYVLEGSEFPHAFSVSLAVAAVGSVCVGVLLIFLRIIVGRDNKLSQLRSQLPIKHMARQLREAWDFQLSCGIRMVAPLGVLHLSVFGSWLFVIGICGVIWTLTMQFSDSFEPTLVENWPFQIRVVTFISVVYSMYAVAVQALAALRIVNKARYTGRFPVSRIWNELGQAVETLGLWGTLGWALAVSGLTLGVLGAGFLVYTQLLEVLDRGMALGISLSLGLIVYWLLIIWPHLLMLAVLTRRDCGWILALEMAGAMIRLERGESLLKAFLATVAGLTIIGLPFAIHLMVAMLDYHDLILSAVLREKTWREVESDLRETEADRPETLKKFYSLLDDGRFLDALNGFQMHLMKHRQDVAAIRGEALAYLYIGNPRSRESLERWISLDPAGDEPQKLLTELNQGLWSDSGVKYAEAQKRCTQQIGRGIGSLVAPGWDDPPPS